MVIVWLSPRQDSLGKDLDGFGGLRLGVGFFIMGALVHLFKNFWMANSIARFAFVLIMVAVAGLSNGCNKSADTGSPSAAPGKPKIALVMKSLANEFFSTMADGAKKHHDAHAADYDLVVNGIKNETDLAEQVNLVEQMIAQRCQCDCYCPGGFQGAGDGPQTREGRGHSCCQY